MTNDNIKTTIDNNFSSSDIEELVNILSMYQPLLDAANTIMKQLLILAETKSISIPDVCANSLNLWLKELGATNVRMNAFVNHETIH